MSRTLHFQTDSNDFQTAENVLAQAELEGLPPEAQKIFQDMVEETGFERREVAAKKENKHDYDNHQKQLERVCRVCGLLTSRYRQVYDSKGASKQLLDTFYINVETDKAGIHPEKICFGCWTKLRKRELNPERRLFVNVHEWERHQDKPPCKECEHFSYLQKGGKRKSNGNQGKGRPKSLKTNNGCKSKMDDTAVIPNDIIPPPITSERIEFDRYINLLEELVCPVCKDVLYQPVQSPCEHTYCYLCLERCFKLYPDCPCPACKASLRAEDIKKPHRVLLNLLDATLVRCAVCKAPIKHEFLDIHEKNCSSYRIQPEEDQTQDVSSVLRKPMHEPLDPVESKLATSLIRRMKGNTSSDLLTLKTGGTPLHIKVVSRGRSVNPSVRTLQRRTGSVTEMRKALSGKPEDETRLQIMELNRLGEEERAKIAKEADIRASIGAGEGLAMKAALGLPWNKIRHLRRWLQSWGIHMASEKKQRILDKECEVDEVTAEEIPFTFKLKEGGTEIRLAPLVQVQSLKVAVLAHLEANAKENRLTWHDGLIPENEVWLKLGGDKGGGSFKCSFEIANLKCPNACQNSVLFSVFKAQDSPCNLHVALDRYKEEINDLKQATWRGKTIRIFILGDYAFLCILYGLSGASGCYCCLWCLILNTQLKTPLKERNLLPKRTLELICSDNEKYKKAGSPLKKAKEYNNAIGKPFFDVPLTQVCLPGLHLSLGIFKRLHQLFVQELSAFDLLLAHNLMDKENQVGNEVFQSYVKQLGEVNSLEQEAEELKEMAGEKDEIVAYLSLHGEVDDDEIQLIHEEASTLHNSANQKAREAVELRNKIQLNTKNGPCVERLQLDLQKIGVQPQAYHGGEFIGNHVNTCLKDKNVKLMVSVARRVCQEECQMLVEDADRIEEKFTPLFTSFSKCHTIYSEKGQLDEKKVSDLGKKNIPLYFSFDTLILFFDLHLLQEMNSHSVMNKLLFVFDIPIPFSTDNNITFFMAYYRKIFPKATVTPKLHILEDHLMEWVRRYDTGLGLLGEQGAESLHAQFNQLGREYCNVRDEKTRFHLMVKEQHRRSHPSHLSKAPPKKKRKIKRKEE